MITVLNLYLAFICDNFGLLRSRSVTFFILCGIMTAIIYGTQCLEQQQQHEPVLRFTGFLTDETKKSQIFFCRHYHHH